LSKVFNHSPPDQRRDNGDREIRTREDIAQGEGYPSRNQRDTPCSVQALLLITSLVPHVNLPKRILNEHETTTG